jgi:hypothetical protein
MITTRTVVSVLAIAFLAGCAMDGKRTLTISSRTGEPLTGIVAVPLYSTSGGVSAGADGKGIHSDTKNVITRPFVLDSGDDLAKKKIQSRGLLLPPLVYVGSSNYLRRCLLLKAGYQPLLLDESALSHGAIIMEPDISDGPSTAAAILLSATPSQEALRTLFETKVSGPLLVELDDQDRHLLSSLRSQR